MRLFYERSNANVHRSIHTLGEEATELYEAARDRVRAFLGARHREEIVFTKGTTEAINLVVHTWARRALVEGDEILLSEMEHHSNLVPWILLARERKLRLRHVPGHRRGDARPRGVRPPPHAPDAARRPRPRLERPRHDQSRRRDHRAGSGGGGPGPPRRRPGGAAPAGRRRGAGRRLLRVLGPQAGRPDRHRRALRPARGAGAARAVLRRERDHPRGLARPRDLERPPVAVRAGHAAHRRGHRPRRRHRLRGGAGTRGGPPARRRRSSRRRSRASARSRTSRSTARAIRRSGRG